MSSSEIATRDARADDASEVRRLLALLGHRAEALTHVDARLAAARPDDVVIVAERASEMLGVACAVVVRPLEYARPQLRLSAIAVDAGHRRGGIARTLVRAIEARAQALGCFRVELTSAKQLHDAHAFWRAIGYDEAGLRFVRAVAEREG